MKDSDFIEDRIDLYGEEVIRELVENDLIEFYDYLNNTTIRSKYGKVQSNNQT